ncbi:flagellar basal body rod protein FlgB [Pontibacillus halophilus JSM 076056 = DSM 19796]|uniref:Flagellar basal body rod protein FlgB n=1 Tax=Pontibacillus halophilus JSM 076056 = DSM 19796 TaxID=1385510 RepID=A0A0A5GPT5_9BACI|nr:flagellar basal body rod protein FlgB [Pontibacillus halophilus]KGX93175.1 flagellar basal body rod protein FlgB [Pontibacillus halophilus JSM 076056 = DSM 19796]
MGLFSSTIHNLESSLDYASAKNKTISSNIANVDTPNYKAKEVSFKGVLSEEVGRLDAKRTNDKHMSFESSNPTFTVKERSSTTFNNNGNNVDMDQEMTELAKNQLNYQALVNRLNGKFRTLQDVLKGGS